jgi:PTH1 family peptidyl-tRNA hydrolase
MTTIIIGLGNPGKKFEGTRHNVGFMIIDNFAEKNNFSEFELSKKSNSLLSENVLDKKIILVKPQTFMNDSGKAVREILENNPAENIIVIHDDVDLPVGKIKIVEERGSAGHKGVESIIENIGNKGLIRIRIGIAPQKEIKAKQIVLKKFSKEEKEIINNVNNKTIEALDFLLQNGLEKAMNKYN